MSHSPAAASPSRADVAAPDRHRKRGVEALQIAELSRPRQVHGRQIDRFEMQPIRDHQLDVVLPAGSDHLPAFVDGDRQRLLHKTCTPARAARIVYSACMELGSAM